MISEDDLIGIGISEGVCVWVLPRTELTEVLESDNPDQLLIGVGNSSLKEEIVCYTGELRKIHVPWAWLEIGGLVLMGSDTDCSISDYGQTLLCDGMEIAVDMIMERF
jgi:hypothetical protein